MPQQIRFRQPRTVLRTAAQLPASLPLPGAKAVSDTLNSFVDSLPGLGALPTPLNINGLPTPPSPRSLVAQAENLLPAGLPRLSNFLPDVQLDGVPGQVAGAASDTTGAYRDLPRQGGTAVRPGGYRSMTVE